MITNSSILSAATGVGAASFAFAARIAFSYFNRGLVSLGRFSLLPSGCYLLKIAILQHRLIKGSRTKGQVFVKRNSISKYHANSLLRGPRAPQAEVGVAIVRRGVAAERGAEDAGTVIPAAAA